MIIQSNNLEQSSRTILPNNKWNNNTEQKKKGTIAGGYGRARRCRNEREHELRK